MFCLSKGLSAPVGSMLAGPRERIEFGRRLRKALGGGMRQVGVLAAPGLIALTEMVDRLEDDHARAKALARGISGLPGRPARPGDPSRPNIVIFGFEHPTITVPDMIGQHEGEGHPGPGRQRRHPHGHPQGRRRRGRRSGDRGFKAILAG